MVINQEKLLEKMLALNVTIVRSDGLIQLETPEFLLESAMKQTLNSESVFPVAAMAAVLALGTANNVEVEFGDYTVKISKD